MKKETCLIHLSDLHIGYKDCGQKFLKIARNIINAEDPSNRIIMITGDIVEDARKEEDQKEALGYIEELKKHNFSVLLCPGNHDYGTGMMNSRRLAQRFQELFMSQSTGFPQLDIINNIAFIGLDSSLEELHWYDRFHADGELGRTQLANLKKILNSPEIKNKTKVVYLHHHPFEIFPFHQLKDSKKLKAVVAGEIDILLYGHNHLGHSNNGAWGIKIVLDAGSSTGKRTSRILGTKIKHRVISLTDFSIEERNYLNE